MIILWLFTFSKYAFELLLLQITYMLRELKVRQTMHIASAKTAEHGEQINLANVRQ
jgi:hypothetical protein